MSKRMIIPLLFGLVGCAILLSLGTWQVQRLAWKERVLAEIEANMVGDPVPVPAEPNEADHQRLAVTATGDVGDQSIRVLVSQKRLGAGYRIISAFDLGGRIILLDRGFVAVDEQPPGGAYADATVTGNLLWPDEIDSYTPEPDIAQNIWFARDIDRMATHLGTDPVLLVLREASFADTPITPLGVTTQGIPNDHLQYAITWFLLAIAWAGMTAYLLWRIRQRTV